MAEETEPVVLEAKRLPVLWNVPPEMMPTERTEAEIAAARKAHAFWWKELHDRTDQSILGTKPSSDPWAAFEKAKRETS